MDIIYIFVTVNYAAMHVCVQGCFLLFVFGGLWYWGSNPGLWWHARFFLLLIGSLTLKYSLVLLWLPPPPLGGCVFVPLGCVLRVKLVSGWDVCSIGKLSANTAVHLIPHQQCMGVPAFTSLQRQVLHGWLLLILCLGILVKGQISLVLTPNATDWWCWGLLHVLTPEK